MFPSILPAFDPANKPKLMPTDRDTVFTDNAALLYRFRNKQGNHGKGPVALLVPSMINRWYVMDLREGASLIEALVASDLDVYCIDWGNVEGEDRYFTWQDVQNRLQRMIRATKRVSGQPTLGILGYCMGATLASIAVAQKPEGITSFVNLAGPIDFSKAGMLGEMVDPRWFDPHALAAPGNITPKQMQDGFTSMRPTLQIGKWIGFADRSHDPKSVEAFVAMEAWANDNVEFPAAAYTTYISELYQGNKLVQGSHRVGGERVDLKNLTCPVLVVCAARDTICPPPAATALIDHCGAKVSKVLEVPGGHVGAVIGSRASRELYPAIAAWFRKHGEAAQQA